jgi:hypothetical protein
MKFVILIIMLTLVSCTSDVEIVESLKSSAGHDAIILEYTTSEGIDMTDVSISFGNKVCIKDVANIETNSRNIRIRWVDDNSLQIDIPEDIIFENMTDGGNLECGFQDVTAEFIIDTNI